MSNAEMIRATRIAECGWNDHDHVGDHDYKGKCIVIRCNGTVFVFKPKQ